MKKYLINITWIVLLIGFSNIANAQITLDVEPAACDGSTKGKITVTVGISGNFEYSLNGGAYQASNVFDNLDEGNYTVTVREIDIMCEFSRSTTVGKDESLSVSVSGGGSFQFCEDQSPPDITLTASASGGTPPYNYSWPGGSITVNSSGTYTVNVTDSKGCSEMASVQVIVIPIVCSRDPNDMIGPAGYGDAKWVSVRDELPYIIRFENDPEFATAPAQKVVIEHILDDNLNLFSLRLSDFGFANLFFEVPPNSTYYTQRLDVVDSLGVYVNVTAGIDVTENKAFWIFESIDALTGLEPSDPLLGMLPVNDTITRKGEGFVSFSIKPKSNSITKDTIFATADIVFDINETIATPEIFNVIDAFPPTSQLDDLPPISEDTVFLSWTAVDDPGGCGVAYYDIYVSENEGPYNLYYAGITTNSYTFSGVNGNQYDFFVRATDNVGNQEALKNAAESTTIVGGKGEFDLAALLSGPYIGDNKMSTNLSDLSLVPLAQPYNTAPWNYMGTETVDSIASDVVDWVLVSVRRETEKSSVIGTVAALLLEDGRIVNTEGGLVAFEEEIDIRDSIYIAVYHRNHVGVMSAAKVGSENNVYAYDFTTSASQVYGGNNATQNLAADEFGLWSGDADGNGQVQNVDNELLLQFIGNSGYRGTDLDMNSEVQNSDRQIQLLLNIGKGAGFEY